MTTRQLVICDACGRDIDGLRAAWALVGPRTDVPLHFHGAQCLERYAQGELARKPPEWPRKTSEPVMWRHARDRNVLSFNDEETK